MKKVNWKVYGEALDAAMAAEHFVYNGYVVDYKGGDQ